MTIQKMFTSVLSASLVGACFMAVMPATIQAAATETATSSQGAEQKAADFVKEVSSRVIQVLNSPQREIVKRQQAFEEIFQKYADVSRVAAFVGGAGWRSADEAQKQAFVEVFKKYMAYTYAKRFETYSGETVNILRVTDGGKKGMIIQTRINRPAGAPPVLLDWQIRPEGETFKVVDLVVEQVSMSMTQRSEFQVILDKNNQSLEKLTADLKARLP